LRIGKNIIVPALRKHAGQKRRVCSEHSPKELRGLEATLKKIGKRAAALMEYIGASGTRSKEEKQ
jgi:hypothetical protein